MFLHPAFAFQFQQAAKMWWRQLTIIAANYPPSENYFSLQGGTVVVRHADAISAALAAGWLEIVAY